jgi:hypothetical protein
MAVALVTGVFSVLLAVLSWLLTNGSKRGVYCPASNGKRLCSRTFRRTTRPEPNWIGHFYPTSPLFDEQRAQHELQ